MGLKREINEDLLAALAGPFHPVTLLYVDWPDAPVRVHSGVGTITWGGEDWIGIAGVPDSAITLPDEGATLAMVEGTLRIGGDPALIDEYLGDAGAARNRAVQMHFGAVTARAGTTLIGAPFDAFTGKIGGVTSEEAWQGDTAMGAIEVQFPSGPSQRSIASATHSYDDQRRVDPDDTAGRWLQGALGNLVAAVPKW